MQRVKFSLQSMCGLIFLIKTSAEVSHAMYPMKENTESDVSLKALKLQVL